MNKSLIILIVVVVGYLGLDQLGKRWRNHLKSDPYAAQLDTTGAKKAIAEMDRHWAVAAERFGAADFDQCYALFDASWEPLNEYTFRFGDRPYADGRTLKAWLTDHQSQWSAALASRRADAGRAMSSHADLGALEKLRRRLVDPKFDAVCAGIRADVAKHIHASGSALVVELNETETPRSRKIAWVTGLRSSASSPYLVFARAAEAATLGDLPFVGYLRASSYDNLSPYLFTDGSRRAPPNSPANLPGAEGARVGMVERIDFLLEPDPYAQKNLGLQRCSCASIEIKLPESFSLGTQKPAEFIVAHRGRITDSLDHAIARLPKMVLRQDPEYAFCSLQPRAVMSGGTMPSATSDSPVEQTFAFRR